jgi:hypothetical protein
LTTLLSWKGIEGSNRKIKYGLKYATQRFLDGEKQYVDAEDDENRFCCAPEADKDRTRGHTQPVN